MARAASASRTFAKPSASLRLTTRTYSPGRARPCPALAIGRRHGQDAPGRSEVAQDVIAEAQAGHVPDRSLQLIDHSAHLRFDLLRQVGEPAISHGGVERVDDEGVRGQGDRRQVVLVESRLIEPGDQALARDGGLDPHIGQEGLPLEAPPPDDPLDPVEPQELDGIRLLLDGRALSSRARCDRLRRLVRWSRGGSWTTVPRHLVEVDGKAGGWDHGGRGWGDGAGPQPRTRFRIGQRSPAGVRRGRGGRQLGDHGQGR